ncbi:MAG TPA: PfkB family carbohydrate kinase [Drouetiella sp.]
MGKLVVIGCASLDVVHVERDEKKVTHESAGGAALYTALAARGCGIDVTLVAPRPNPIPPALEFASAVLNWVGPECSAEEIPRLEIVHYGEGKATLIGASWGAEHSLATSHLPLLNKDDFVHIAALSSAQAQMKFLREAKRHKATVSVGTYARLIQSAKQEVLELFANSDFFFMNANEFRLLFEEGSMSIDSPDQKVFVTDGAAGATIYNGNIKHRISAPAAVEFEPTGAGDTFCGVTLGEILRGIPVVEAAKTACAVASSSVEQIGPTVICQRISKSAKI